MPAVRTFGRQHRANEFSQCVRPTSVSSSERLTPDHHPIAELVGGMPPLQQAKAVANRPIDAVSATTSSACRELPSAKSSHPLRIRSHGAQVDHNLAAGGDQSVIERGQEGLAQRQYRRKSRPIWLLANALPSWLRFSCRDAGMTLAIARGSTPSARNLFSQV